MKLKDLPNLVGYDDPRNAALIKAIQQRLAEHNDDGKKAFIQPLHKPGADGKPGPVVRALRMFSTQKSGLPIRSGVANNGDMLRVDIFLKNKKFFAVPLYVADLARPALFSKAALAYKPEAEWPEMDDSYQFLFSLHKNDWVRVTQKGKAPIEGYFAGFNRATAAIDLWAHDRNQLVGRNGKIEGIGIKTALAVEKFHVDVLGRLYPGKRETRQPLRAMREED